MGVGRDQPSSGGASRRLRNGQLTDEPAFRVLVPLLTTAGAICGRYATDAGSKSWHRPELRSDPIPESPQPCERAADTGAGHAVRDRSSVGERAPRKPGDTSGISPDLLERLGSLGYVSQADLLTGKRRSRSKDKLDEFKALSGLMQQALVAMRRTRLRCGQHLREVERRGLDSYELHFYLGRAYAAGQHWREAGRVQKRRRSSGRRRGLARTW